MARLKLEKKDGGQHVFRSADGHVRLDLNHSSEVEDTGFVEGKEYDFAITPAPAESAPPAA